MKEMNGQKIKKQKFEILINFVGKKYVRSFEDQAYRFKKNEIKQKML